MTYYKRNKIRFVKGKNDDRSEILIKETDILCHFKVMKERINHKIFAYKLHRTRNKRQNTKYKGRKK